MIDVPQEFDSPEYADSKMKILGFGKKGGSRSGGAARRGRARRGGGY